MRHTHFLEIDLQAQGIPTCTYRGQVWRAQAQGLPEEDRARGEGGDAQRGNADMFTRANARRRRNKSNNVFPLRLDSDWDSSSSSSSDSD
jgi:hypothetical protein